jgi:hypothetical protein
MVWANEDLHSSGAWTVGGTRDSIVATGGNFLPGALQDLLADRRLRVVLLWK